MAAPPSRDDISGSGSTPSNAQARAGFGALWDYVTGLLGLTGTVADARTALGFGNSGAPGNRNLIIDSRFRLNSDGVSGTVVLSAGQYGHDMWKAGSGGCTYTFSSSGVTISAGSLIQIIDGADIEGGSYCATWTGTAQAKLNGGSFAASGVTASGVAASANLPIEFGTGTVNKVQVEMGTSPTTYEWRRLADEIRLGARYYQKGDFFEGAYNLIGYAWYRTVTFRTPMRAAPTMSGTFSLAGFTAAAINAGPTTTSFTFNTSNSGNTGQHSVGLPWTANARL